MSIKPIQTRIAELSLDKDGIARIFASPSSDADVNDAREIVDAFFKITGGEKSPLLVDLRTAKSATREARVLFSGYEMGKAISASALLIGSPVSRVLGNFYLGFNKPQYPLRLFTSEADATAWLKEYKE